MILEFLARTLYFGLTFIKFLIHKLKVPKLYKMYQNSQIYWVTFDVSKSLQFIFHNITCCNANLLSNDINPNILRSNFRQETGTEMEVLIENTFMRGKRFLFESPFMTPRWVERFLSWMVSEYKKLVAISKFKFDGNEVNPEKFVIKKCLKGIHKSSSNSLQNFRRGFF